MKKKLIIAICAVILTAAVCVSAFAADSASIFFENNLETIELIFSDAVAEAEVSETEKDGHPVTMYELTVTPGSSMTEILLPQAGGRYTLLAEDTSGAKLTFDGGTFTDADLESLIYTNLMQREAIQAQIAAAMAQNANTDALNAALKEIDDNLNYYMTLRENLKKALTVRTVSPANRNNITIRRETVYEFIRQGTYTIWLRPENASAYSMAIRISITDEIPEPPPQTQPEPSPEPAPESALTAVPTLSIVYVNGVKTDFDAYNINGNNYFKLRDLAFVLSGTEKQFEVTWDNETSTIGLVTGIPYTPVGGEMSAKGAQNKTPVPTNASITLDGAPVTFTAYNIDGNNYFKLRDVGSTFDFNVSYNAEDSSVIINTAESYTED